MTRDRKRTLTLAQVAKLARATDAAAWDAMSADERRRMVDALNAAASGDATRRAALAAFDRNMDQLRRAAGRKR